MDDDLAFLEAELQRLRPIGPTPALRAAIARCVAPSVDSRLARWGSIAVPIAASLAVLLSLWAAGRPRSDRAAAMAPAASTVAANFTPISADHVLILARDEGLVTLGNGARGRCFRQLSVDSITWKNPATNASLTWTLPREEVRVLPISYQ